MEKEGVSLRCLTKQDLGCLSVLQQPSAAACYRQKLLFCSAPADFFSSLLSPAYSQDVAGNKADPQQFISGESRELHARCCCQLGQPWKTRAFRNKASAADCMEWDQTNTWALGTPMAAPSCEPDSEANHPTAGMQG